MKNVLNNTLKTAVAATAFTLSVAQSALVDEVIEQIESIRELGFGKLQLMFLDFPDTRGIELFGDEVRPALQ